MNMDEVVRKAFNHANAIGPPTERKTSAPVDKLMFIKQVLEEVMNNDRRLHRSPIKNSALLSNVVLAAADLDELNSKNSLDKKRAFFTSLVSKDLY